MANIAKAIEPKSDQQNAVDYQTGGPRVFTVAGTSDYLDEKRRPKVAVHLVEAPDRPFKPSATNLRLMVIGWGQDDAVWTGRRIKLDLDPEVRFGGEKVGGIRVVALSNMEQPFTAKLPTTRGKKAEFRVEKLDDAPAPITEELWSTLSEWLDHKGIEDKPNWITQRAGRTLNSPMELSADEASKMIEELSNA